MDDQRRSLIITAFVTLLIIAMIIGLIIFLVRFIQNRTSNQMTTNVPTASSLPNATRSSSSNIPVSSTVPFVSSTPFNNQVSQNSNIFVGQNFRLRYPKNWGLLTCSNSANFELDPTNSADQLKFPCDRSVKPVTVLVGEKPSCPGDRVNIGTVSVIKSKVMDDTGVSYRWCTQTNPVLDITHRVSKVSGRATSKEDYSTLVEEIIKTFTTVSGGS